MPRAKLNMPRTKKLSVRLSEEQHADFNKFCHYELTSMTDKAYQMIVKYLDKKRAEQNVKS